MTSPATGTALRFLLALALLAPRRAGAQTAAPPYRDPTRPIAERVRDLLGRMTPAEKFWQLYMTPGDLDDPTADYGHGAFGLQVSPTGTQSGSAAARSHAERINEIQHYFVDRSRLGIPIIPFDEGVHGLPREGATVFPQAIALAATWDTALMARVATAVARESRSRGIRQLLAPVVNVATDVRWGRTEETYGEDPFLSSRMAAAYVHAVEAAGVVATPKHFVANVGEGGRDSYPIEVSERRLIEEYFPPFRAALEAGAQSIMSAYNSVDGSPASQSPWLLDTVLRRRWGFGGYVISDAAATGGATVLHNTEATTASAATHALSAGLDVIFQSSYGQHAPWWEAFRQGLIPDSVVDRAVARVLGVKFGLGLFEHPYVDPDSAARINGSRAHRALAREAAEKSIVLLRNRDDILPLSGGLRAVAVIGTDASDVRLGGYSGPATGAVSILQGIRDRLGPTAAVRYAPGPGRLSPEYAVIPASALSRTVNGKSAPGLSAEYFADPTLQGEVRLTRVDSVIDFSWTLSGPAPELPLDWYGARWSGTLTVPRSGLGRIGIRGNDGYRLYLDGRLVLDRWRKESNQLRMIPVTLAPGSTHAIRVEYFETTGNGHIQLVWDAGVPDDWQRRIDSAVALVRLSSVAIVVVGIEEGEFRDRASLRLPGHQEELIHAIAKTGRPVVVVLVGGSAVTMSSWLEEVSGVVDVWYPGEAGGGAVAGVLFGDINPAGRLPITFPLAEGQLPLTYNHKPTGRGDDYLDLTGQPLFPFGFGLSYTTFEYGSLSLTPSALGAADSAEVRFTVRNTGRRAGDEVVQLYLRDLLASVARPVLELKGFQRIHLEPGESREVRFQLGPEALRMLDADRHWVVEPGEFLVLVGASSRDLRLRGTLTVR